MRGACLGVLGCLIAACATTAPDKPLKFIAASGCVATLDALPRLDPAADDHVLVEHEFDGGTSCIRNARGELRPALLFSLGKLQPPIEISVVTMARRKVTFAASVSVLDAQLRVVSRHPFDDFAKRGPNYSLAVFVSQSDAAYLLIEPDDAWLGKENLTVAGTVRTFVWSTGLVTGVYSFGEENRLISTFSDVGAVSVAMKAYSPPVLDARH